MRCVKLRDKKIESCVAYMKTYDLKRFMQAVLKKYRTYGEAKGNVLLKKPTASECDFFRGLFRKDFSEQDCLRVSLLSFERSFEGTRFTGVTLLELLEGYFGESISDKKMDRERQRLKKDERYQSIVSELKNKALIKWITDAFYTPNHIAYRLITQWISEEDLDLNLILKHLEKLLDVLEQHEEGISFPLAAAKTTGYPHDLDKGMPLRKWFAVYAQSLHPESLFETLYDQEALFEKFNICFEEVPRMVLTYGLEAYDASGVSLGWERFKDRREPLHLNKFNLRQVAFLKSNHSNLRCFENPAAFYQYIRSYSSESAICTHGQPHLLDFMLLDLIIQSGIKVSYSGDFDPEGLWIAERLKRRYPSIDLSFFSLEKYLEKKSHEEISDKRLKQLKLLREPNLVRIAEEMKIFRLAGYEEVI